MKTLTWTFTFLEGIFAISSELSIFSLLGGTSSILRTFLCGTSQKNHPVCDLTLVCDTNLCCRCAMFALLFIDILSYVVLFVCCICNWSNTYHHHHHHNDDTIVGRDRIERLWRHFAHAEVISALKRSLPSSSLSLLLLTAFV